MSIPLKGMSINDVHAKGYMDGSVKLAYNEQGDGQKEMCPSYHKNISSTNTACDFVVAARHKITINKSNKNGQFWNKG